jgi:hypothetical protein
MRLTTSLPLPQTFFADLVDAYACGVAEGRRTGQARWKPCPLSSVIIDG